MEAVEEGERLVQDFCTDLVGRIIVSILQIESHDLVKREGCGRGNAPKSITRSIASRDCGATSPSWTGHSLNR